MSQIENKSQNSPLKEVVSRPRHATPRHTTLRHEAPRRASLRDMCTVFFFDLGLLPRFDIFAAAGWLIFRGRGGKQGRPRAQGGEGKREGPSGTSGPYLMLSHRPARP